MNATIASLALLFFASALPGFGQAKSLIVGGGYGYPAPLNVAPGEIVTIFVQGIGSTLTDVVRGPGPSLSTTLAGISVSAFGPTPLGILEVRPVSTCNPPGRTGTGAFPQSATNCGMLTAVTVQIPFGVYTVCNVCIMGSAGAAVIELTVFENGASTTSIELNPIADRGHVLNACDLFLSPLVPPINYTGLPCAPSVTHADGSLVSHGNPAKSGEEVVIYAVGLGNTDPLLVAGQPVTSAAVMHSPFQLHFDFTPNALPTRPRPTEASPLFVGATPGYVGLYQINLVIPTVPAGTPACAPFDVSQFDPGTNIVQSNLTVSIGGIFSFDGAGICVAAP